MPLPLQTGRSPDQGVDSKRLALASPIALIVVATLLAAANLLLRYPGEGNPDSDDQYRQILAGRYNDWHPPVMARLWSLLRVFGDGTGPIFSFHVVLYWLGFGLVAATLARRSRPVAAWCVVAIGALPPLLMLSVNIAKDIGLGVALLCSFAIVFASRARGKPPTWVVATAMLLIAYAALVRGNAVFAVGPLLLYAWPQRAFRHPVVAVAGLGLLIAVAFIPVSSWINRQALRSEPGGAIESLLFFDVAGTAREAHDETLFGARAPTDAALRRCYSPIMWDTLPQRCPDLWAGVRGPVLGGQGGSAGQPSLGALWLAAIRRHPLAYVEHRLLTFNSTLYLYVPPHHTEYVRLLDTAGNRSGRWSARVLDGIRYNWLTAPATMLALACSLLWLVGRSATQIGTWERTGAGALLTSSILYTFSFLPFGVATDMRYFFWPTIAVLVATVLLAPALAQALRRGDRPGWLIGPVGIVLLLIALSRMLGDATLLVL